MRENLAHEFELDEADDADAGAAGADSGGGARVRGVTLVDAAACPRQFYAEESVGDVRANRSEDANGRRRRSQRKTTKEANGRRTRPSVAESSRPADFSPFPRSESVPRSRPTS